MDSSNFSPLSPRYTPSLGRNTSNPTHRPEQMPPDVGVRPVNVNPSVWRDVLFAAAAMGNVDIVRSVLAAGLASPDSSNPDSGDTALMHAAQYGKADMVKYLLDARATVDQTNNDCLTALGLARIAGQSQAVHILEQNGAFSLFSCDTTRQCTPEQQMRINQAERALYSIRYRSTGATRPAFMSPATSDGQDRKGLAPAERHGDGISSRMPEHATQAQ